MSGRAKSLRTALRRIARFRRFLLQRIRIVMIERDLRANGSAETRRLTLVPVEQLAPEQLLQLAQAGAAEGHAGPLWVKYSWKRGYGGRVALLENRPVAYLWYVTAAQQRNTPHPHCTRLGISLAEGELYFYEVFVHPAFRGQGLGAEFMQAVQREFRAMGVERLYAWVAEGNVAARAMYRRCGYRETGVVTSWRILRSLLWSRGRVFLRNGRNAETPLDYRPVFGGTGPTAASGPRREWRRVAAC